MNVTYDGATDMTLEQYFSEFVLPKFGVSGTPKWERHVQTDPDSFVHVFIVSDTTYALSFEDYPGDFSVSRESFVRVIRCEDGSDVLSVQPSDDNYYENITGYFMLFQVCDTKAFTAQLDYLELAYRDEQCNWRSESQSLITVSRDILQLAEVAALNHDSTSLYSLQNIIDGFTDAGVVDNDLDFNELRDYVEALLDAEFGHEQYDSSEKERRANVIYEKLAREANYTLVKNRYNAQNLGQMVTLVSAMYSKQSGDTQEGISICFIVDGSTIECPAEHFMNSELQKYFATTPQLNDTNAVDLLPPQLGDYRLVNGSAQAHTIFRREIEYMNF